MVNNISLFYSIRDDDMQSVASLMSIGKTDIGNLEEIDEETAENSKDFSSEISKITSELSELGNDDDGNPFGNPFLDDDEDCCDDSAFFGLFAYSLPVLYFVSFCLILQSYYEANILQIQSLCFFLHCFMSNAKN